MVRLKRGTGTTPDAIGSGMAMAGLLAEAGRREAGCPLSAFPERFHLPAPPAIYLDGNSLGPLPRVAPARLRVVIEEEWGEGLIQSWDRAGWMEAPTRIGDRLAPLLGSSSGTVIACDSVSVNLFRLIVGGLRLAGPGKRTLLMEAGDFPTDGHIAEAACRIMGSELRAVPRGEVLAALGPDVAMLLLSHVHYRTGAAWNLAEVGAAARAHGALTLVDLSHSAGVLEVGLEQHGIDLATGCGYKFLCGGPGAPAFAFVARRHLASLDQPLSGWMGHAAPFAFEADYRPDPGIRRLLAGTPPILAMAALEAGVETVADAPIAAIAARARSLTGLLFDAIEALAAPDLSIVTPRDPALRGAQLSLAHPRARALHEALLARGITGDFRTAPGAPDLLRLGVSPLTLTHMQMVAVAEAIDASLMDLQRAAA
jgi:kynureninase